MVSSLPLLWRERKDRENSLERLRMQDGGLAIHSPARSWVAERESHFSNCDSIGQIFPPINYHHGSVLSHPIDLGLRYMTCFDHSPPAPWWAEYTNLFTFGFALIGIALPNEILADMVQAEVWRVCVWFALFFCTSVISWVYSPQGSCFPFSFGLEGTHRKQIWSQPVARSQDHLEPPLESELTEKANLYQLNWSSTTVRINAYCYMLLSLGVVCYIALLHTNWCNSESSSHTLIIYFGIFDTVRLQTHARKIMRVEPGKSCSSCQDKDRVGQTALLPLGGVRLYEMPMCPMDKGVTEFEASWWNLILKQYLPGKAIHQ